MFMAFGLFVFAVTASLFFVALNATADIKETLSEMREEQRKLLDLLERMEKKLTADKS